MPAVATRGDWKKYVTDEGKPYCANVSSLFFSFLNRFYAADYNKVSKLTVWKKPVEWGDDDDAGALTSPVSFTTHTHTLSHTAHHQWTPISARNPLLRWLLLSSLCQSLRVRRLPLSRQRRLRWRRRVQTHRRLQRHPSSLWPPHARRFSRLLDTAQLRRRLPLPLPRPRLLAARLRPLPLFRRRPTGPGRLPARLRVEAARCPAEDSSRAVPVLLPLLLVARRRCARRWERAAVRLCSGRARTCSRLTP
jgi:hypothetical protein